MNEVPQPDIFEYGDYRLYLADCYASRKAKHARYSHRVFARQAGLGSPSHLSMIIKGERNLSLKTIEKFSDGLGLSPREKKCFELLVLFNQSSDLQVKAKLFSEIMMMKASTRKLVKLEKDKFDFLAKWYVVAIYVLVDLGDFKADPTWLAKRLGAKITPAQARDALDTLTRLDMIENVGGKYLQKSGAITVPDDTRSVAVYNYHHSMLRLAADVLRSAPQAAREMNGATIAIPKAKLPELKEKIRQFRKEINQLASSYADPDEVYQLNIQFFRLTEGESK